MCSVVFIANSTISLPTVRWNCTFHAKFSRHTKVAQSIIGSHNHAISFHVKKGSICSIKCSFVSVSFYFFFRVTREKDVSCDGVMIRWFAFPALNFNVNGRKKWSLFCGKKGEKNCKTLKIHKQPNFIINFPVLVAAKSPLKLRLNNKNICSKMNFFIWL